METGLDCEAGMGHNPQLQGLHQAKYQTRISNDAEDEDVKETWTKLRWLLLPQITWCARGVRIDILPSSKFK
jgi:hypothetical protein